MLIALNKVLRAQRRRLALTLAAVALAASVVGAHSALAGGDHMGMGVAMCLAVVDIAFVAVGVILGVRRPALRLPLPPLALAAPPGPAARAPQPRARAGPAVLQVFRR